MSILNPNYLSEQECKEIASKQILSFISLSDTKAASTIYQKHATRISLFSLDALPEGALVDEPPFFNWMSHDIYDVDGLLLFRDQTLDIGSGNEWCVRTAASDLLRTQTHCVYAGPTMNISALKEEALAEVRKHPDWEPLIVEGEKDIRVVSYNYPNLGILAYRRTDPDAKFVIKLGDLTVIPIDPYKLQENPESLTAVWSPYDVVVRSTIAHFRQLWKWNMGLLPELPKRLKDLPDVIRDAGDSVLEVSTTPPLELIAQETSVRCAAATAQMILKQHDNTDKNQKQLADAMNTGDDGATPEDQREGINKLFGRTLQAELDLHPSLEKAQIEIRANRSFKTGDSIHARAVGGFRVEKGDKSGIGGKNWLHIYDPEPTNQGRICCEPWDANSHGNFMYIRPV